MQEYESVLGLPYMRGRRLAAPCEREGGRLLVVPCERKGRLHRARERDEGDWFCGGRGRRVAISLLDEKEREKNSFFFFFNVAYWNF
jgi:hypothetical protein